MHVPWPQTLADTYRYPPQKNSAHARHAHPADAYRCRHFRRRSLSGSHFMPSGVLCTCIALWLPEAWVLSQDAFQQPGEARGGEYRGEVERWRGVDSRRSRETERERGRKYRPNYRAALMRYVSTIQLLLSKYLMWPSRLSAQCPPALLSCSAAGGFTLSFLGYAQSQMCVYVCAGQGHASLYSMHK